MAPAHAGNAVYLRFTLGATAEQVFHAHRYRHGYPGHPDPVTARFYVTETDPQEDEPAYFIVHDARWMDTGDPDTLEVELEFAPDSPLRGMTGRWVGEYNYRTRLGFISWIPMDSMVMARNWMILLAQVHQAFHLNANEADELLQALRRGGDLAKVLHMEYFVEHVRLRSRYATLADALRDGLRDAGVPERWVDVLPTRLRPQVKYLYYVLREDEIWGSLRVSEEVPL